MRSKKIIAMLLAGGQGSRLGVLTSRVAKPAVPYGGKYRIIDFPLSNCVNSDIDTVGVLTQYRPLELHSYIGNGQPWDLDRKAGGVYILPPYVNGKGGEWYSGTANAIYQNSNFIEQYHAKYVLILSGDHIYKMDYAAMLKSHESKGADATIAVIKVPPEEVSRFGIMSTDSENRITAFEEKPQQSTSDNASMGIYIFTWDVLKRYLERDAKQKDSNNDFGQDIIPAMLANGQKLYSYPFNGYWKDVGTIESLWQANMDLLETPPLLDINDIQWRIYGRNESLPPHFISPAAWTTRCLVAEGAIIRGSVSHSIIFSGAMVDEGATVVDSLVFPGARVGKNASVVKSIIGERATISDGCVLGVAAPSGKPHATANGGITVVGEDVIIPTGANIPPGIFVSEEYLRREVK